MENDEKVSIIVPVYNVEEYIERGIESIINQDYQNLEIILVDDGSKDNSGVILDNYAKRDPRIIAIHQENSGVSCARNAALKRSTGKYIMFIDGDDYVENDYVLYFLSLIKNNNVSMAIGMQHYSVDLTEQNIMNEIKLLCAEEIIKMIYTGEINVAVWNKIYCKDVIEKNNIFFDPNIWYGEGMLFNIKYLQCVDKIAVGNKKVYHQVFNPGSAMRNFNLESQYCGLRSLELQKSIWRKKNKEIEIAYAFHYRNFCISIIKGLVNENGKIDHKDVYEDCKKKLHKGILLPWKVNISLKMKIIYTLYAIIPKTISKRNAKRDKVRIKKQERMYKEMKKL